VITLSTVASQNATVARADSAQVLVGEFFEMNTSRMSVILDHYIALYSSTDVMKFKYSCVRMVATPTSLRIPQLYITIVKM